MFLHFVTAVDDKRKAKNTACVLMDIVQEEGLYVLMRMVCPLKHNLKANVYKCRF